MCGYQPFQAEDQVELIDEITHARYDFHERYWRNISEDGTLHTYTHTYIHTTNYFAAKDFIKKLLTLDDKARLTAHQALHHPWTTSEDTKDDDILDTVRENFNPRRTLKSAVGAIRAMNRLRSASTADKSDLNAANVFASALQASREQKQAVAPAT